MQYQGYFAIRYHRFLPAFSDGLRLKSSEKPEDQ